jgi:hypothetical protein
MIDVRHVLPLQYRLFLAGAQATSERVAESTTPAHEMPEDARYFLTEDSLSGFGVSADGDLIGLFSLVKGRDDDLIGWSVRLGTETLDCFDGYLPTLYARHGFTEVKREANWTPGGPDVVYMRRA